MNKVLIVNANNNVALTMARGLGCQGVPVDGVGWDNGGVGMHSRYLGKKIWIDDYKQLSVEKLEHILSETQPRYIMAMGEEVLTHLNTLRDDVSGKVKFLFPEQDILERAFDKTKTLQYARRIGIEVPRTFQIHSIEELGSVVGALRYPVVLKFSRSVNTCLPGHLKFSYRYIFNSTDLKNFMAPYNQYKVFPLIQEYVAGRGVGVELCINKGEIAAAFQHERVHELPISGGPSVYRKSVPLTPDLLERSGELLRAMEWDGVAMVEFRKDPASTRSVLMEVNGRFWGSLPLAVKAGVNFPYILYKTMGEGEAIKPVPYRVGVRVKQSGSHIRWLWQAFVVRGNLPPEGFMSRSRVLWEFLCSLDPRVMFDIEEWDDPIPGIMYWLAKFKKRRAVEIAR